MELQSLIDQGVDEGEARRIEMHNATHPEPLSPYGWTDEWFARVFLTMAPVRRAARRGSRSPVPSQARSQTAEPAADAHPRRGLRDHGGRGDLRVLAPLEDVRLDRSPLVLRELREQLHADLVGHQRDQLRVLLAERRPLHAEAAERPVLGVPTALVAASYGARCRTATQRQGRTGTKPATRDDRGCKRLAVRSAAASGSRVRRAKNSKTARRDGRRTTRTPRVQRLRAAPHRSVDRRTRSHTDSRMTGPRCNESARPLRRADNERGSGYEYSRRRDDDRRRVRRRRMRRQRAASRAARAGAPPGGRGGRAGDGRGRRAGARRRRARDGRGILRSQRRRRRPRRQHLRLRRRALLRRHPAGATPSGRSTRTASSPTVVGGTGVVGFAGDGGPATPSTDRRPARRDGRRPGQPLHRRRRQLPHPQGQSRGHDHDLRRHGRPGRLPGDTARRRPPADELRRA